MNKIIKCGNNNIFNLLIRFFIFCCLVIYLTYLSGNNIVYYFSNYIQSNNYSVVATVLFLNFSLLMVLFLLVKINFFFSFLFSFFLVANYISRKTSGTILNSDVISLMMSEFDRAGDYFNSYFSSELLVPIFWFFLASVVLKKISDNNYILFEYISRKKLSFLSVLFFSSLAASYVLEARTHGSFNLYIDPFRTISKTVYLASNSIKYSKRMDLLVDPERISQANHILLIIDESISYSHLSINGYEKDTTPYLASIKNKYSNMGKSLSSFNCSAASNFVFTADVSPTDIPDLRGKYTLTKPGIFSFAKKANYKTAYISAQRAENQFQNYMSKFDLEQIDMFHSNNTNGNLNDFALIDVLSKFIDENEKTFTIIVKSGAHFPWSSNKYEGKLFEPVLPDGNAISVARKLESINSYDNIINWNTDRFFESLIKKISDLNIFIIYTSDHGQNIFNDEKVPATHCTFTGVVPPEQAFVPILVFGSDKIKINSDYGFYSHFNISPTIKYVMGFGVDINDTFFSDSPNKYDYFFIGNMFSTVQKVKVNK